MGPQRVALVTGSSRGLGAAIARRLARDGLAVAVNDSSGHPRALDVVGAIRADGGDADVFTADVTDERQVTGLAGAVSEALGPIVVLVLNATGPQPDAPLAEVGWEDHVAQLRGLRSRGTLRHAGGAGVRRELLRLGRGLVRHRSAPGGRRRPQARRLTTT